ncbi:MlaD family protein [Nocardia asteroides]|uniref:MlaD family protein n=1 Tax=Nocardia asteroides TaxID=1824 RepID=UPI001E4FF893|nr:MlaD family protein [Nocardia asteroides]UGT62641.1 MlaD family protein [Nocardia asteroides]
MLTRVLGSRGFMSVAVLLTLVLVAVAGFALLRPAPETRGYCADMPDSIGLYEGSAVTVYGVRVGEVTGIEPLGNAARVRFTVRADRKLPADVGAVTVNDTVLADRKLELVGPEPDGPGRNPAACISRALTPQSLSRTFDALAGLADQLNGVDDPAQRGALGAGLDGLDAATAGTGAELNTLLGELARALNSPQAAIDHIGALIDALTALVHRARNGWATVENVVTELPPTFTDIVTIAFPPIIQLVDDLASVLPQLNDVVRLFVTPAVRSLNQIPDLPALLAAGVGSLAGLLERTPAIATGFASAADPVTGRTEIGYAPTALALPAAETAQICAGLLALGQPCPVAASGAIRVPIPALLLGAVSAR